MIIVLLLHIITVKTDFTKIIIHCECHVYYCKYVYS